MSSISRMRLGDVSSSRSAPVGPLRQLTRPPSAIATPATRHAHRVAEIAGAVLLGLGLFTVSWDRLANIGLGPYNVKLPSLLLSLACVLALIARGRDVRQVWRGGFRRSILTLTAIIVVYELVRGAFSSSPSAAVAQVAAVLSGAVLPALAVLLLVRSRADVVWALRWFLAGAVVASVFGLYQLLAFYLGWPQGIDYTGVGIGTSIGRISAFSYEPAYFSYFLVLALGAYLAIRRLTDRDATWRGIIAFAVLLYLANVRAVPLLLIAFGVLLLIAFRTNRKLILKLVVVGAVTGALAIATPFVVDRLTAQPPAAAPADTTAEPSSGAVPLPTSAATGAPEAAAPAPLQAVDPSEQSSNGPRLGLYKAVIGQIATSPIFGIGPGNLTAALRASDPGAIQDQQGGQVVANNIWLQALADGGVPLLLLELALVVVVAVRSIAQRGSAAFPLAAGWLSVVLVGGMLTSYIFDIKVWTVLGLLIVLLTTGGGSSVKIEDGVAHG